MFLRREIVIALLGLAVFALLWFLLYKELIAPLDLAILHGLLKIRTDKLDTLAVWITNLGSINMMVPLAMLVSAGLFLWRRWSLGVLFLATLLWYPILFPLRLLADRMPPRAELRSSTQGIVYVAEGRLEALRHRQVPASPETPQAVPPPPPWYSQVYSQLIEALYRSLTRSFPSNHAAASAYFFGICMLLAWQRGFRPPAVLCAFLIFLIGLSRLYMAVHYLSDVLASWSLVVASLGLAAPLLRTPRRAVRLLDSKSRQGSE
jgi:membrane-associated phospholipid phosphatase